MACVPGGQDEPGAAGRPPFTVRRTPSQTASSSLYLRITAEHYGSWSELRLDGELDVCNRDLLENAISEALERGSRLLAVDLSALAFMDCAGLSVLAEAHRLMARSQRRLVLAGARPIVRRLIGLTGLDVGVIVTSWS